MLDKKNICRSFANKSFLAFIYHYRGTYPSTESPIVQPKFPKEDYLNLTYCNPFFDFPVKTDFGKCTPNFPCGDGEGDCDTSADCKGNLVCGVNNCGASHDPLADCCTGK